MRERSRRIRTVDNSSPSAPAAKYCLTYCLCNDAKTIACLCMFFLQFWNATRLDHRLRDEVCEPRHTIFFNKIMDLMWATRGSELSRGASQTRRNCSVTGHYSRMKRRKLISPLELMREAAASLQRRCCGPWLQPTN